MVMVRCKGDNGGVTARQYVEESFGSDGSY